MEIELSTKYLQNKLTEALKIIRKYDWLIDAYVLDFYVDNHWSKLPMAWHKHLDNLPIERLSFLLNPEEKEVKSVWPLEMLALRQLNKNLNITRKIKVEDALPPTRLLNHPKLRNVFTKCVKPKKRHEIEKMAAFCNRSTQQTPVDFVVDFGAGLGHLARVLGYGYGIKVCCLEMQNALSAQAGAIDLQLEAKAAKHLKPEERSHFARPTHVVLCLSAEMETAEFMKTICHALQLQKNNFSFGIIGLHPCGDLGAILMKMFLACEQAKFLNFVGCCYMKLSTKAEQPACTSPGYPLSNFLSTEKSQYFTQLSYTAREISSHATEVYCQRLRSGNYEDLKVHSFRAATERILIKHWPELKHCGIRSVKHAPGMSFEDYYYRAVQDLPASKLPLSELLSKTTCADLLHWQQIVIFYTLRLIFAPLIESVVLYDRLLFLQENHCFVEINAIFDPFISPRNHITKANKTS